MCFASLSFRIRRNWVTANESRERETDRQTEREMEIERERERETKKHVTRWQWLISVEEQVEVGLR